MCSCEETSGFLVLCFLDWLVVSCSEESSSETARVVVVTGVKRLTYWWMCGGGSRVPV